MAARPPLLPLFGFLLLLYLAQGLPAGLLARALPVLAREAGLELSEIGFLGLLALPWALKFLWAPWVERRPAARRHWVLGCQALTGLLLMILALQDPQALFHEQRLRLALLLLAINLCCATQDIAADGLAVTHLPSGWRGPGNAVQVGGYKLGMMLAGGALLISLDHWGWQVSFLALAMVLWLMLIPVALWSEPVREASPSRRARSSWRIWQGFWKRPGLFWWGGLLLLYKAGDALGSRMMRPWLVDQGWSRSQIGVLEWQVASAGLAATVLAGLLLWRRAGPGWLVGLGLFQGAVFGLWVLMTGGVAEPTVALVRMVAVLDAVADALATVALFTLMMLQCRSGHEGADYAMQASLQVAAAGALSLVSGLVAEQLGYDGLFLTAALLSVLVVGLVPLWQRPGRAA